ncbi:50S ribosomal protein L11 methyltransferase [Methylacidimicrobium sp. B4]|uniref:50S ribosomal protein L11 methyltransferase n=1 Tax=Methylacidimicrobium sp. B4 TaxID=2796139 RepID=UPI001A8F0789|nr:50S ribosomal protein L11 methyltransferase [Methylacidimicrobium sp. B4]QSR85360.1 50S ribosomal protein L11 methyltransferase [Methylacidimicrobium sp. B4]
MNEPALLWIWSRLVSAKMADCWVERLHFLGEGRLALHRLAGRPTVRLEAYLPDLSAGHDLLARYGGKLRKVPSAGSVPALPGKPIRIGGKLRILTETEAGTPAHDPSGNHPLSLVIPAGMAFGTGRHATTGMLLREMAALPDWRGSRVLDIGTGSGILALAARRLGATRIWALDTDPSALEVARQNEGANFAAAAIRWIEADLARWRSRVRFERILANLFLMPLLQGAARLAAWLAPQGVLLVSGLLREQAPEVEARFRAEGLSLHRRKRRGNWIMLRFGAPGHCHSTGAPLP